MAVENFIGTEMHTLPENCIANVLSLTNPKDACRLSLVASNFYSAAQSDAVWERFLPPDYRDLISRAANSSDLLAFTSKKDLYFHLCDHPVIIDGGTKSFSLDKESGKKCYMLAARSLHIFWGNDPRYWTWISVSESRFSEVAELLNGRLFDVTGKISTKMLSPDTIYGAYLVFTARSYVEGFESQPVDATVVIGEPPLTRTVYLDPKLVVGWPKTLVDLWELDRDEARIWGMGDRTGQNANSAPGNIGQHPKMRGDRWMEVELGEIWNRGYGEEDLLEIYCIVLGAQRMRGIVVQGIEIRPCDDSDEECYI